MPLPKLVARINRRLTNPLTRLFAGRVPPFAIVIHTGRRSGAAYRTPVMAFASPDGIVIALTYGKETDWVRNVLAAGGCTVQYRGRTTPFADASIVQGVDGRRFLPRAVQVALRLLRVDEFLRLSRLEA